MVYYLLTISDAADELGVSKSRVSQLISSKVLDAAVVDGQKRVSKESVAEYRASRRVGRLPRALHAGVTEHVLMNADYPVASVLHDPAEEYPLSVSEVFDASRAPVSVLTMNGRAKRRELNAWWEHRSVPQSRPGLAAKLAELGLDDALALPYRNLGLSLSDCYWLKPISGGDLEWSDVNYFENDFIQSSPDGWDGWLSCIGLDSPDNTSEGELPKKWVIDHGRRVLLKGCRTDDQRPVNEAVATELFGRLLEAEDFVPYELVRTSDGLACACGNFLQPREEYVPATYVKEIMGRTRGTSQYDRFCRFAGELLGDEEAVRIQLSKMLVCDSILANGDRHWRNFGLVRNVDTLKWRVAPIFDSGNCLWFCKSPAEIACDDWSFTAKPFGPQPSAQLARVDRVEWFASEALDGFADQAYELLRVSSSACSDGRLDFIRRGLEERIAFVSAVMEVAKYR